MEYKVKNCIATVNFYYEKCSEYFEKNWDGKKNNDWKFVLKNYYLMMFRNSIYHVYGHDDIYEELKNNIGKYLTLDNNRLSLGYISVENQGEGKVFIKLGSRYRAISGIFLNIYIITVYLYMNQQEYLSEFSEQDLIIIFYLVMYDGSTVPDEMRNIYDSELTDSGNSENNITNLRIRWATLIRKYMSLVNNYFDKDVDTTWEIGMKEEEERILDKVLDKIHVISRLNGGKEVAPGIKKVEK